MASDPFKDIDPEQMRRAATAVNNLIGFDARNKWADWVPRYLDRLADAHDAIPAEERDDELAPIREPVSEPCHLCVGHGFAIEVGGGRVPCPACPTGAEIARRLQPLPAPMEETEG